MNERAGFIKEITHPKPQNNYSFNSPVSQRQRLLDYMRKHGSISTVEAREQLDVLHPAGRMQELRAIGHVIHLVWNYEPTSCGHPHRVGRYYLIKEVGHA